MNKLHTLLVGCLIILMTIGASADNADDNSLEGAPYYVGISTIFLVNNDQYGTTWTGLWGLDTTWTESGEFGNNQGFGGSIEVGKSLCGRSMDVSLSLVFADISSSTQNSNIAVASDFTGAMLNFEYVLRGEFGLDFYIGAGLGAAFVSSSGVYNNILADPTSSQYKQYVSSYFSDLGEWLLTYSFKLGIYLSSNLPVSLRIGLQILTTDNLEDTGAMSGVGNVKTMYNKTSTYGSANSYSDPTPTVTGTNDMRFQMGTVELGVQYLFFT